MRSKRVLLARSCVLGTLIFGATIAAGPSETSISQRVAPVLVQTSQTITTNPLSANAPTSRAPKTMTIDAADISRLAIAAPAFAGPLTTKTLTAFAPGGTITTPSLTASAPGGNYALVIAPLSAHAPSSQRTFVASINATAVNRFATLSTAPFAASVTTSSLSATAPGGFIGTQSLSAYAPGGTYALEVTRLSANAPGGRIGSVNGAYAALPTNIDSQRYAFLAPLSGGGSVPTSMLSANAPNGNLFTASLSANAPGGAFAALTAPLTANGPAAAGSRSRSLALSVNDANITRLATVTGASTTASFTTDQLTANAPGGVITTQSLTANAPDSKP